MLNETATGYEAYTDFRARRDERAYTILQHAGMHVELLQTAGEVSRDVLRLVQIDVLVAHLAIDVARQTEGA